MVEILLASPWIAWIIAVFVQDIRISHRKKASLEELMTQSTQVEGTPQQIAQREEVTTQSTELKREAQRKFPEWVNQLTERELFDHVYASLQCLPKEEAVKILSGGETFYLSGYRTDRDFSYSDGGRDLYPLTIYRN